MITTLGVFSVVYFSGCGWCHTSLS